MARKCPLPRIGSKQWDWTLCDVGVYKSPHSDIIVRVHSTTYCELEKDGDVFITVDGSLESAMGMAELLTRRAYRRRDRSEIDVKLSKHVYNRVFVQLGQQFANLSTADKHSLAILAARQAVESYQVITVEKQPAKKD